MIVYASIPCLLYSYLAYILYTITQGLENPVALCVKGESLGEGLLDVNQA